MTTTTTVRPAASSTTLRTADRCDRCGVQAWVRVVFGAGELLFCAHHWSRHETAATTAALAVTDERERINARPSPAAY